MQSYIDTMSCLCRTWNTGEMSVLLRRGRGNWKGTVVVRNLWQAAAYLIKASCRVANCCCSYGACVGARQSAPHGSPKLIILSLQMLQVLVVNELTRTANQIRPLLGKSISCLPLNKNISSVYLPSDNTTSSCNIVFHKNDWFTRWSQRQRIKGRKLKLRQLPSFLLGGKLCTSRNLQSL